MPATPIGLCSACRHQKTIRSGRGSEFSMCLRHREDPRYEKYPRLPVARCPGFERRPSAAGDAEDQVGGDLGAT